MTWWTIKSLYIGPSAFTAGISCTTSAPDHLFIKYAPWEPVRHLLWRMFRGKSHLCGYKYVWDTPFIAEQALYGDTDFHLFALKNLTPSTDYWGYIFAPDGPYGQEIQGPLMHWKTIADPIPPEITADPIPINVAQPIFRCGNRYTFWANGTWYAHIPDPFSLSIWKLIAGTFVRQDHAHEPVAPVGVISDADSRMDAYQTTIHCSYFCTAPFPDRNHLRYATFDLTTDQWLIDEHVGLPARTVFTAWDTSLVLDSWGRPHVLYTDYFNPFPEIHYRNRIHGTWSLPIGALIIPGKMCSFSTAALAPATNHLWVAAVTSTFEHWYNHLHYGAAGFAGPLQVDTAQNLSYHSLACDDYSPQLAQLGQDSRINYWRIDEILIPDADLTAPVSRYANMIASSTPGAGPLIVFRDDDNNLAYIYRPPGDPWQPQVQLAPAPLILLTAHYATPDVVSCLYTKPLPVRCAFFAFYAPWH